MRELAVIAAAFALFLVECFVFAAVFQMNMAPGVTIAATSAGFGLLIGFTADHRYKSWFPWMLLGALIGVFALIPLLGTPMRNPSETASPSSTGDQKKCPDCAEMIRAEARRCRFCGHAFEMVVSDQGP